MCRYVMDTFFKAEGQDFVLFYYDYFILQVVQNNFSKRHTLSLNKRSTKQ